MSKEKFKQRPKFDDDDEIENYTRDKKTKHNQHRRQKNFDYENSDYETFVSNEVKKNNSKKYK